MRLECKNGSYVETVDGKNAIRVVTNRGNEAVISLTHRVQRVSPKVAKLLRQAGRKPADNREFGCAVVDLETAAWIERLIYT